MPEGTVGKARLSLLRQFQRAGLLADGCPPGQAAAMQMRSCACDLLRASMSTHDHPCSVDQLHVICRVPPFKQAVCGANIENGKLECLCSEEVLDVLNDNESRRISASHTDRLVYAVAS